MGEIEEDDDVVINTQNQAQATIINTAKKNKLNEKKKLKNDKLGKNKKLKEKKNLKKDITTSGTKADFKKKSEDGLVNANSNDLNNEIDVPASEAKPKREWNNNAVAHSSTKNAKFSSLFKNNHEIPKIGEYVLK